MGSPAGRSPIDFLEIGSDVDFLAGRSPIDFLEDRASVESLDSGNEGAPDRALACCLKP